MQHEIWTWMLRDFSGLRFTYWLACGYLLSKPKTEKVISMILSKFHLDPKFRRQASYVFLSSPSLLVPSPSFPLPCPSWSFYGQPWIYIYPLYLGSLIMHSLNSDLRWWSRFLFTERAFSFFYTFTAKTKHQLTSCSSCYLVGLFCLRPLPSLFFVEGSACTSAQASCFLTFKLPLSCHLFREASQITQCKQHPRLIPRHCLAQHSVFPYPFMQFLVFGFFVFWGGFW